MDKIHFLTKDGKNGHVIFLENVDFSELFIKSRTETWVKKADVVEGMLKKIRVEHAAQRGPAPHSIHYGALGESEVIVDPQEYHSEEEAKDQCLRLDPQDVGRYAVRQLGKDRYVVVARSVNCFVWVEMRLKEVGIKLEPKQYVWLDYLAKLPIVYI